MAALTLDAVKSSSAFLLSCLLPLVVGHAQEPALPEAAPAPLLAQAENLGDSLLISEAVRVEAGEVARPAGEPLVPVDAGAPGRRGRWRVAPHLQLKGTYDDNIFIQPDNEIADYIVTVSPGLGIGYWDSDEEREAYLDRLRWPTLVESSRGNFLVVDYTAILLGFAETSSQNAFDHDARFDARWEREKLTLGVGVRFESKSETNADIGGRVKRQTLSAEVTSAYQMSPKTALEVAFYAIQNDPENYVRTTEWRGEVGLDYALTPMIRLGLGGAVGRVDSEGGSDAVFERILARAAYSLSEKFEAVFRGGVEFRQSDGFAGDRTNPIFEASALWRPTANTTIALEGFRKVETSAFLPDQDFTRTGFALAIRQTIRGGLHLSLEGGGYLADYTATEDDGARKDRVVYLRPGLFYSFAAWGSAGVSYEFQRDRSDRRTSSFENNLTSVEIALLY